jgi:hypothetical protein
VLILGIKHGGGDIAREIYVYCMYLCVAKYDIIVTVSMPESRPDASKSLPNICA